MSAKMLDVEGVARVIERGGLAAVPTETVYGLACSALDADAVRAVYEMKGRPDVKPLPVIVAGEDAAAALCAEIPKQARRLMRRFWPGPLTIVLKADKAVVPDIVRAGGDTVALRCPDNALTLELARRCGLPLAAPSANISGMSAPRSSAEVLEALPNLDCILDGGECGGGLASTIADMSKTPYSILREGPIAAETLWDELVKAMTVVGITGGSGCGKTTALRALEKLGALIIDCDEVYHGLLETNRDMLSELSERFGDIRAESGGIDRKRLARIVFGDGKALEDLNRITHRYVSEEVDRRLREHARRGGSLAAIDAIGLIGSQSERHCAFTVAVTAPIEDRVRRLVRREGADEEYIRLRLAAQKSDEYFAQNCGYTLENNGGIAEFENKCMEFFSEVLFNGRKQE